MNLTIVTLLKKRSLSVIQLPETSDKFQKLAQPVDRVPKTKAVTTKYKNLMVAIQDCMNFSELEEVGNNINNSEFEENELNQLRKAWMDQR